MKDCLQIAECCLSSAKLRLLFELSKKNLDFFAKSFVVSNKNNPLQQYTTHPASR
jgi:hypothetical protein